MELAIVLLLGLAIGTAVGWFFRASRAKAEVENARLGSGPEFAVLEQRVKQTDAQLGAANERLQSAEAQRSDVLERLREETSRRASFEALATRVPDLEKEAVLRDRNVS